MSTRLKQLQAAAPENFVVQPLWCPPRAVGKAGSRGRLAVEAVSGSIRSSLWMRISECFPCSLH
jgi:hypothetical protein